MYRLLPFILHNTLPSYTVLFVLLLCHCTFVLRGKGSELEAIHFWSWKHVHPQQCKCCLNVCISSALERDSTRSESLSKYRSACTSARQAPYGNRRNEKIVRILGCTLCIRRTRRGTKSTTRYESRTHRRGSAHTPAVCECPHPIQ